MTADTGWAEYAADLSQYLGLTIPPRYPSPLAMAAVLDPQTRTSAALEHVDSELVALMAEDSPHNALAIFMPAQEGKSSLCSRRLPEWVLDTEPDAQVAIISYQADIAVRWGREIKRDVGMAGDGLRISIRQDSSAAGRWETPEGGGVYCTGIGGPLTGRSVGRLMVIDDPVKDRADAESQIIRQSTWDWYESVALTRLGPRSRVVLIMTRFHEDDLAGRILNRPGPLRWKVITLPALALPGDPLGRAEGEELPSIRGREPGYFHRLKSSMSNYVFASMYMQTPTAAEGNFFRRAAFRYWRPAPPWPDGRARITLEGRLVTMADCWRFATVDVAASTRASADYTCCAVWMVTLDGDLVLLDRRRAQIAEHDHFKMVADLRAQWQFDTAWIEQSWFASALIADARNAGVPVAPLKADTDKITRATPAAGRVAAGKVWWPAEASGCECGGPCVSATPRGNWLDEWCDEIAGFPQSTHDDQVDVLAYAARVVTNDWTPTPTPRLGRQIDHHAEAVQAATSAATGNGAIPDWMNRPLG